MAVMAVLLIQVILLLNNLDKARLTRDRKLLLILLKHKLEKLSNFAINFSQFKTSFFSNSL